MCCSRWLAWRQGSDWSTAQILRACTTTSLRYACKLPLPAHVIIMALGVCVQVVYFHNPKFVRQPQLKLEEIVTTSVNALPLITKLFPDIKVYYDDDPEIPALTKLRSGTHQNGTSRTGVPDTIQEFARPQRLVSQSERSGAGPQQKQYAWLICCSSVFLIDMEAKLVWASPDDSLLPLVSLFLAPDALEEQGDEEEEHNNSSRRRMVDMSSAHGHVTLL
jgi:hypothetical protein